MSLFSNMKKTIIFDWNGTLIDDTKFSLDIENQLFRNRNLREISLEEYREKFCFPVIEYYKNIGFDFKHHSFEQLSTEFNEIYNQQYRQCNLMENTLPLLRNLKTRGIHCLILSASHQDHLNEQVRYFNLDSYFDDVIGTQTIHAVSKVEQGMNWIQSHKEKKEDCLFIGDTIHDSETAKAMGIDCILMDRGHQNYDVLKESGRIIIHDLMELLNHI
ncbi:MAG: HAD hydrolase-like protein [Erysipelotrichaceae bacterium]|uniref:HAD family hydrolase n=1 Tax=Floccifex sp. TaxID=2815810 RepID=UPI002A752CB2|nr:HAD hydrolase-like protein [Floccifex sp.]MDD7281268.1 HAD hydrolase-like protein [Erysipelotrichaceae bacterium]MDY2959008.1 HAD hydrolase-like protein [Floccifex sp.]